MHVNRRLALGAGLFLAATITLAGYYHLRAENGRDPASAKTTRAAAAQADKPSVLNQPATPSPHPIATGPVSPLTPPPAPPLPTAPAAGNPTATAWNPPNLTPVPKAVPKDSLWTVTVDLKDGKTLLIAKARNKDIEFRVHCDSVDLQAPSGGIHARGNVKIAAPQLDAASQSLTILLHDDQLLLEGQAHVKQQLDGQDLELRGERLTLRLVIAQAPQPKH